MLVIVDTIKHYPLSFVSFSLGLLALSCTEKNTILYLIIVVFHLYWHESSKIKDKLYNASRSIHGLQRVVDMEICLTSLQRPFLSICVAHPSLLEFDFY